MRAARVLGFSSQAPRWGLRFKMERTMKTQLKELIDLEGVRNVRFTFTVPSGHLALMPREASRDDCLGEMLHNIVLDHGHRLGGAIFEPLMEGMLEPGEDVIDAALVEELRADFEEALLARCTPNQRLEGQSQQAGAAR
ncbi:MAG: hypothetical protein COW54_02315 [Rhodobacteraceae bacterium CG17_big_fil_post_rev_8_21_14_2_50_63_15]|nr:MAG: hypothetical protein COW54_02315 [Rhodobacteraceae bacterium CG17_big_fil_post_rev_8_21_14_2_50_63_15]